MRYLLAAIAAGVLATPASAQLSDAQLRQFVDYAIARTENQIDEANETIARLRTIRAELTRRIQAGVPAPPSADTTTAPPPPPSTGADFAFWSDWRAGDLTDGGKWSAAGTTHQLSVVDAPAGWPTGMAKVLNVAVTDNRWSQVEFRNNSVGLDIPNATGERLCYRMYFALTAPVGWGGDQATHGWNDGGNGVDGNMNVSWSMEESGDGYRARLRIGQGGDANVLFDHPGTLSRGTPYRFEYCVGYVDANAMTLEVRISDSTHTLYTTTDFRGAQGPMANLTSSLVIPLNGTAKWAGFGFLRVGTNGFADGVGSRPSSHSMFGGVAVASDWPGEYTPQG